MQKGKVEFSGTHKNLRMVNFIMIYWRHVHWALLKLYKCGHHLKYGHMVWILRVFYKANKDLRIKGFWCIHYFVFTALNRKWFQTYHQMLNRFIVWVLFNFHILKKSKHSGFNDFLFTSPPQNPQNTPLVTNYYWNIPQQRL